MKMLNGRFEFGSENNVLYFNIYVFFKSYKWNGVEGTLKDWNHDNLVTVTKHKKVNNIKLPYNWDLKNDINAKRETFLIYCIIVNFNRISVFHSKAQWKYNSIKLWKSAPVIYSICIMI